MSAATTSLEREYFDRMFLHLRQWMHLLPSDLQRTIKIAESLHKYSGATSEEFAAEWGPKWVIARRTKRIVEKYGEDVKCVTHKQYVETERKIIARRFSEV